MAAIACILSVILFVLRRRRPKLSNYEENIQEKAQLDGEGVKPKELNDNPIREMDGTHIVPVEMDAGYAGVEMAAKDTHQVKRKPVPATGD